MKFGSSRKFQLLRLPTTRWTVLILLLFVHIGVNPVRVIEDHVVGKRRCTRGDHFEHLCGAGGGDDRVGAGDGRYDVLDHALGEPVGHPLDPVLLCALPRLLVDPRNVGWVVAIDRGLLAKRFLFGPEQNAAIFNTVLW